MARCEMCGKRDRLTAHHCWECGQTHWRDGCASAHFNDPLRWCWCGITPHWQDIPHWRDLDISAHLASDGA